MPLHYQSSTSKSQKSTGFSINDLISTDSTFKPTSSNSHSTNFLPPIAWLPATAPANPLFHFQRQSVLNYLRQAPSFPHTDLTATALLLNSFRKPKRNRTAFTPAQLLKLEDAFEKNHYIVGEERKQLARLLNLSETKVKVWYQNRRTKQKRLSIEDANGQMNEDDRHRRPSDTSDTGIAKMDDEYQCYNDDSSSDDSFTDQQDQTASI